MSGISYICYWCLCCCARLFIFVCRTRSSFRLIYTFRQSFECIILPELSGLFVGESEIIIEWNMRRASDRNFLIKFGAAFFNPIHGTHTCRNKLTFRTAKAPNDRITRKKKPHTEMIYSQCVCVCARCIAILAHRIRWFASAVVVCLLALKCDSLGAVPIATSVLLYEAPLFCL